MLNVLSRIFHFSPGLSIIFLNFMIFPVSVGAGVHTAQFTLFNHSYYVGAFVSDINMCSWFHQSMQLRHKIATALHMSNTVERTTTENGKKKTEPHTQNWIRMKTKKN